MFPYMKAQNWLFNYQYREGMANSFGGLVRRAAYLEDSHTALALFDEHYAFLHSCYRLFFPGVLAFARDWLVNAPSPE
jgi:acyl carrier protein phosphodiesterase